jgi:hypothetical protein
MKNISFKKPSLSRFMGFKSPKKAVIGLSRIILDKLNSFADRKLDGKNSPRNK